MRYLNKIVFINSAHVPYAEVMLDGNIHFIGTQGVGKSSLLRAILFFYNANKGNLGIGKGQRPFDDFYLPAPDSYIIYEVVRENGRFFVVVDKHQGRAAYRFVDCAYDKRFFIDTGGKVYHEWGRISAEIGSRTFKSPIIRQYQTFRDIIYGNRNNVDKNLRRFNIMDSAKYQNIPLTIQNIFLNQSLESRVIKDTIISSMDFTTEPVRLSFFREHITSFRKMYEDTLKWYRADSNGKIKVMEDARRVEKEQANLAMTRERINTLAAGLVFARHRDTDLLPQLKQQEEQAAGKLARSQRLLSEEQSKYTSERDKHMRDIGSLEEQLKQTKERRAYWDKSDIKHIVTLQDRKASMQIEADSLRKEYDALSAGGADIRQKYESLIADEQQKLRQLKTGIDSQKLALETEFLKRETDRRKQAADEKHQLEDSLRTKDNEQIKQREEIATAINNLKLQRMKAEQTDPNADRRGYIEGKIRELEKKEHELDLLIAKKTGEEQKIASDTEAKCRERQTEHEKTLSQLDSEQTGLQKRLQDLTSLIERQDGALITWLSNNVEGWEQSLGKVLDEEAVLYNTQLSPRLINGHEDGLMGVNIDLSQVDREVRTPSQLMEEKDAAEEALEKLKAGRRDLCEQYDADIERIKKKPSELLRAIRSDRAAAETNLRIIPQQRKALAEDLSALKESTEKWHVEQREAITREEMKEQARLEETDRKRNELQAQLNRGTKDIERSLRTWLSEQGAQKNEAIENLNAQLRQDENDFETRKEQLTQMMHDELQGKGLDPVRLRDVHDRAEKIAANLNYLEHHQQEYFDWQHDTKELFDREEQRRTELQRLKKKVENLREHFSRREERLKEDISLETQTMRKASERHGELSRNLNELEEWLTVNSGDLPSLDEVEEDKTDAEIPALLGLLRDQIALRLKNLNSFRRSVDQFTGNFSQQNTFNFKTDLSSEKDYADFATDLREFVALRKMDEYRNRTTEIYTHIIEEAARHMGDVMKDNSQVQKIISRINTDFKENNFVGVIKDIQLRAEPSNDRLTQMFLKICTFSDETSLSLGDFNLFSDEKQRQSNNLKALQLVEALAAELDADPKRDSITLADTFKLEFKIRENDNDTSWVEKLSNVGSDGTDVLVKAMVNIMLINVFKSKESKKFSDFKLHCMMDEIGKLHPNNVRGILDFANKRNIFLINSSPTTYNASEYRYTYTLSKDSRNNTIIKNLLTIK